MFMYALCIASPRVASNHFWSLWAIRCRSKLRCCTSHKPFISKDSHVTIIASFVYDNILVSLLVDLSYATCWQLYEMGLFKIVNVLCTIQKLSPIEWVNIIGLPATPSTLYKCFAKEIWYMAEWDAWNLEKVFNLRNEDRTVLIKFICLRLPSTVLYVQRLTTFSSRTNDTSFWEPLGDYPSLHLAILSCTTWTSKQPVWCTLNRTVVVRILNRHEWKWISLLYQFSKRCVARASTRSILVLHFFIASDPKCSSSVNV